MDGQAELAPTSYADIANLLANNPDLDSPLSRQADGTVAPVNADNAPADEPQDLGAQDDDQGTGTDPADDEPPRLRLRDQGKAPALANDRKGQTFEVTVTGEDGKDTTLKVDHQERGAGYLRHADYTRKTQELANQSREAATLMEGKIGEAMSKAAQCTQFAINAISDLAGFLSAEQMAQLAAQNPSAYNAERARVDAINVKLNALQAQIEGIKQQGEQAAKERKAQALAHCWSVLRPEGINEQNLMPLFEAVMGRYSVPRERFKNLDDPALVLIMRDAIQLHDLKAKAESVRKEGARAPTATPRQVSSRTSNANADFARKARAGRANINDLASLIGRLQG